MSVGLLMLIGMIVVFGGFLVIFGVPFIYGYYQITKQERKEKSNKNHASAHSELNMQQLNKARHIL